MDQLLEDVYIFVEEIIVESCCDWVLCSGSCYRETG